MSRSIKACYLSSITTSWSLALLSVLSSALVLVAGSWDRLVGSATLLLVLGAALLSAGLPGHLLHHIPALLPGGGETLPAAGAGALLLVNILGDGGELVLADLVRNLVTHLAGRVDITADLLGDVLTDLTIVSGTLALLDLPGLDLGHQRADSSLLVLAVLAGNLAAGLSGEHLTLDLGHLGTLQLGHLGALLLGEAATLPLGSLGALGPGGGVALLLVDSLALLLGNILALLSGNLSTLLLNNIPAHLRVVNLLADLSGHRLALLSVHGV